MNDPEGTPTFRMLDLAECQALLGRHNVGRLAFTFRDKVDIEPIHYVYSDGQIFGRTQFGKKVEVLVHHPWVAFEVDEIDSMFAWRSAVVHGRIVFPNANGTPAEQHQHARAVEAFRTLLPDAFTEADPTPARELVFVLHINDITGRAATSTPGTK